MSRPREAAAGILLGVALVAALLAFGTFRAVASLAGPDRSEPEPAAEPAATRVSIYSVGSTTPTPAPAGDQAALDPPPPAGDGDGPAAAPARAIERLVIPEIGVDAPVVVKGLDQHRVMEAPDGPAEVVWYDFTAFPGRLGNAVFSGHLDFPGVGPAVFWRLREVTRGTRIDVLLADGTTYHYQVVSTAVYREATAPVRQIIGPTPTETITLITCTGLFDRTIGRYEDRLVVRAERIAG
ncbi:MAG: class F sortase [Sphaerobacter sp.]|nr:class F sortase [Sphaerobacter sp.]